MGIRHNAETRIFSLATKNSTYQMLIDHYGRLLHLYYGPWTDGDARFTLTFTGRGFSGSPDGTDEDESYSLDTLPQEFPTLGTGDYRKPALIIRGGNGIYGCDLKYCKHEICKGKYSLPGLPAVYAGDEAQTLKITLRDETAEVEVILLYGVVPETDVITRSAVVRNIGSKEFYILRAQAANLDFMTGDFDLMTFYGRHGMERVPERQKVEHKSYEIGSRRGSSSHQYNPLLILAESEAGEEQGNCYAMEFVYSGGFEASAEKDQFNQIRMQMGLATTQFSYPVKSGESFIVPEVILSFSGEGLRKLSWNLADTIKKHVIRGKWKNQICPVLLNSWEAVYMDFDGQKIRELATEAKELGMDLLVLDDGWFGDRNDDHRSLGDWRVNEAKLGGNLRSLAEDIHRLGLLFGIWIEPEMVSENSHLYRQHPDWALKIPGKGPIRARHQLVLDFSRDDVVNGIYDQISAVLREGNIDYLKWDYNRNIADVYSARTEDQGKVLYDYVLGVYRFLERLHTDFPDLLIEGCSGGGGRFDAGMLYYTPQIWCSDNTDAIDRLTIQYGTSFGYPASAMGAHVSAVPNEQSGRSTPFATRGYIAMSGTFGYELDPGKLSQEERRSVREQICLRNELAELVHSGHYLRLTNPLKSHVAAWGFLSKDQKEAVFFAVVLDVHCNMPINYVRLSGLKSHALYINENDGVKYPSDVLMNTGLPLPRRKNDYNAYFWHLRMAEDDHK